jgi:hypothetical protein
MKPCWKPRRRRTWARQKNHETWGLFEREKWGGSSEKLLRLKLCRHGIFSSKEEILGKKRSDSNKDACKSSFQSVY